MEEGERVKKQKEKRKLMKKVEEMGKKGTWSCRLWVGDTYPIR